MNITLTLNYIQRIDKRPAMLYYIIIQIPCLPSDGSITKKMEKLSYFCQIVTRACHTFVTYLFTARPGEWRHIADALYGVIHHDAVTNNRNNAIGLFSGTISISSQITQYRIILLLQPTTKLYLQTN